MVTMLHSSGQGSDSQWFDWRPTFYGGTVRVEWEKDTMEAELPRDLAETLLRRGYAKPHTPAPRPERREVHPNRGDER